MVNEISTPGTFIDMIRKGNYPIILNVELKNLQKTLAFERLYF